jgi:hypothetical protein
MSLGTLFALILALGLLLVAGGAVLVRLGGAQAALARRLAGPAEVKVGRLLDDTELPERPVRVVGRIRCRDPLDAGEGERLVAYHRDVEVRVGGRWRSVERMRETRSFDLWDHDGSVPVDPARAADPLITIPKVWRGDPSELEEPHASAVARLVERHGPATEARAVTRTINVTDRLLVVARPLRDDAGRVTLEPPDGGYLISTLDLPDAMRVLGGRHGRLSALAVAAMGVGIAIAAIGVVGMVAVALIGA